MKHFTAIENHTKQELEKLLELAKSFKAKPFGSQLKQKTLISIFMNPSTRTKTSFDLAMHQLGGHNISIEPGKSSWGLEIEEGAIMDKDAEEHLKDATKVLCKYGDALALRCFPKFKDWNEEKKDKILKNMVKWSDKPVINMETISHPCQALAMMQTIIEKLGDPKGKKFVLTWAYHPKPLNTAVANSAAMIASMFGMDITIANPEGYDLDPDYIKQSKNNCKKNNANFKQTHTQDLKDADFVYAKSWGSLEQYGNYNKTIQDKHKNWIVNKENMPKQAYFSHCLPVRRNMIVTDQVIDSKNSLVYEEAENRLHVQKAILKTLIGEKE
ncbi:MAG: N-acetylornithine carbamoyltransferase [Nanoarchaeota archaeon]|nr:N-acetylornithine carbamoyltransferase [Nanoarchaeota archaeon]MBU1703757.1 N-acetylornithine carbamoyltransferase [Nanoarchaeota archaeon]